MKPYSMDLRERVIAACDAGDQTLVVAGRFEVCPAWVRRLKQRRRTLGHIAPLPHNSGRKRALDDDACDQLKALVAAKPDATLEQLRESLDKPVSIGALWNTLERLKLSLKKSRGMPPSRIGPTSRRNAPTGPRR